LNYKLLKTVSGIYMRDVKMTEIDIANALTRLSGELSRTPEKVPA